MRARFAGIAAAACAAAALAATAAPAGRAAAIDCILAGEPSLSTAGGAAADFQRLVTFERIRTEHGSEWPREAWAASFDEFNREVKHAIEPVQRHERGEQARRLRRALGRFDAAELRTLCATLRDPYFAGLRAKALAADARLGEGIARYASGEPLTDEDKKRLVDALNAREQELTAYRDAHRERFEALTGSSAFRKYEAIADAERQRADQRIRDETANSMVLRTVIGKWEGFAARGPLKKR